MWKMMSLNYRYDAEKRRDIAFSILVAIMAFTVYVNSLGNGFVWDDDVVIVANSALRHNTLSLFSGIDSGRDVELTPYYRPLTLLTFLIEERLYGLIPFPMHLLNVLLHAANAFLVYLIARSLINNKFAPILTGLLFAVHPVNSEAVNFISGGRNTLLSCFCVLMAYLLHRRSIVMEKLSWALAGAVFFFAGLFSKEITLAILPFVAALEIPALRSDERLKVFWKLAPYVACTAAYFILRNIALSDAGVNIEILPGLGTRLLDNLYIIPRYLLTVIWPLSLSIRYFVPDDLHLLSLPLFVAWLVIIGILGWMFTRGRSPATLFGLSWLVVFWLPVSGIILIPSAPLADRYLYTPAIGLWIIVADQTGRFFFGNTARRYGVIAITGILLIALSAVTMVRNLDWKSDITLFSRYVEQYPERAYGHHNLGCAYLDKAGDLNMAEKEFEKTLALDPFFPRLRTQLGYIQLLRGDYAGAIRHYNEAIVQNPFDAEAHLNRATALDRIGRYEDAVADYKRFLAIPGNDLAEARIHAAERVRELSQ